MSKASLSCSHYMVVCVKDKRIIEQCSCVSARKRRIDVPCPAGEDRSCWERTPSDRTGGTDEEIS